jgi:hypothetical protein
VAHRGGVTDGRAEARSYSYQDKEEQIDLLWVVYVRAFRREGGCDDGEKIGEGRRRKREEERDGGWEEKGGKERKEWG